MAVGIAAGTRTCDVAGGEAGGTARCKAGFDSHIQTKKVSLKSRVTFPWRSTHVIIVIISLNDDRELTLQVIVQTVLFWPWQQSLPPTHPQNICTTWKGKIYVILYPSSCQGSCTEYLGQAEASEPVKRTLIWVNSRLCIQVNVLEFLLLKHQNIILETSMTIRQ